MSFLFILKIITIRVTKLKRFYSHTKFQDPILSGASIASPLSPWWLYRW